MSDFVYTVEFTTTDATEAAAIYSLVENYAKVRKLSGVLSQSHQGRDGPVSKWRALRRGRSDV